MTLTIVVEHGIIAHLGGVPSGMRIVARRRSRWWRRHRTPWASLDPEAVLDTLAEIHRPAVVLARRAVADPGARCLIDVARLLGLEVRTLPDSCEEAAWIAGIAGSLGEAPPAGGGRALDVLCCGPAIVPTSPRQRWGPTGISVPALRPGTIARWASCAWRACRWCAAGGLPGDRCRRCGNPIDAVACEDRA
jgi:hypothetical protein